MRGVTAFLAAIWLYVGAGVAAGLKHPPTAECRPTWDDCLTMEWLCERTKQRAWKPCRAKVAACFRAAERCHGGWTW